MIGAVLKVKNKRKTGDFFKNGKVSGAFI